jgi:hypothetical protein
VVVTSPSSLHGDLIQCLVGGLLSHAGKELMSFLFTRVLSYISGASPGTMELSHRSGA